MKKVISMIIASTMLIGAISGCGTKENPAVKDGKIQLSVSHWANQAANPKAYEMQMKQKAEFEALNPDVEIIPDEWSYDVQTYLAKAEAGTLPILYKTHFTEINKIKDLGYAADLTEISKKYGLYDEIDESIRSVISNEDKVIFIPSDTYTMGLVMNIDLFKQAGLTDSNCQPIIPETFEELAQTAKTITEKTGKAGFVFPTAENGGGWTFTLLAWNFGGEFMEEKDGKWIATFGKNKSIDALEWLKDMKWKYNTMPSVTKVNNEDVTKLVGTGQAAMAIIHPKQSHGLMTNYGMDPKNIGYAKMPEGPAGRVTLLGGQVYAVSNQATSEQIDAAYRWLDFLGVTSIELSEEAKKNLRETYQMRNQEKLALIGIYDVNLLSSGTEKQKYLIDLAEEFRNIPKENVESYNDKEGVELRAEERICAQDLYSILDSCIQEVFTNENADCAEIMENAASEFQKNFLDYEN